MIDWEERAAHDVDRALSLFWLVAFCFLAFFSMFVWPEVGR